MCDKISVCIATHNGEKYIRQQLTSILDQIGDNYEVIISDDNSSDATLDIIRDLRDPRIRILSHTPDPTLPPVMAATANFENALRHASGDYIFLADQDDVWLPDKVKIMMKTLSDCDYVVSDCFVCDSDLNVIQDTRFDGTIATNKFKALLAPTPFQGGCAAFKRTVLKKALPFPRHIQSHDRWIGFIGSFFFSYKILPMPLIYYRRHDENVSCSGNGAGSKRGFVEKALTRVTYIVNLALRALRPR